MEQHMVVEKEMHGVTEETERMTRIIRLRSPPWLVASQLVLLASWPGPDSENELLGQH